MLENTGYRRENKYVSYKDIEKPCHLCGIMVKLLKIKRARYYFEPVKRNFCEECYKKLHKKGVIYL